METVNVNIETPEIRVDVVQNEPPVVVVNVERQVIETVDATVSRPVAIEARAGKNGERGERGGKGERGDKGEPGKDGANGKDGPRGERGEKGERGAAGADGERGTQGIKGDKGDRGEKGERGEQGKEGKEGQRGRDGKDGAKGEKGDKGEPGERGEKGRDGKDGIGFPGPPGKQGPPGNSAPHTHPLSEIEQSGATDGQVPIWDEGAGEWIAGNAPGGGGASIIEKTYAEMQAHIAADELVPGQLYNITDAAGTDMGFICLALTENEISVSGNGGYLNADFQAVGDYSGVEAETGTAAGTQLGIWRTGFEALTIPYTNLQFPPDYVSYSASSGLLDPAETFTTDLGTTGEVITDDGAGTVTVQNLSQPLVLGEVITGDISGETVTVDSYTETQKTFLPGETITGSVTGATATIVTDDGASSMTAYMTSPGVGFDGSEVLDNGAGVTADMDGAASSPSIVEGDIVIWNLKHWQLTDVTVLDGTNPATNTAAYTELAKTVADVGYVAVWDISEFDFPNEWLQYRQDLRGNKIRYEKIIEDNIVGLGINAVSVFQWGSNNWYGNTSDNGFFNNPNLPRVRRCIFSIAALVYNITGNDLSFYDNIFYGQTQFTDIDFLGECTFIKNTLYEGANFTFCDFDNLEVENNILLAGASVSGVNILSAALSRNLLSQNTSVSNISGGVNLQDNNVLTGASVSDISGDDLTIENNILENGASMTGITAGAGCVISTNKVGIGATLGIDIILGDNVTIEHNILENNAQFTGIEAGNGSTLSSNKVGQGATFGGSFVLEEDTHIDENTLSAGSSLFGITTTGTGCEVSNNNIGNDANMASLTLAGGTTVEYNILEPGGTLNDITTGASCSISRNKIGQGATMGGSTTLGGGASMDDLEIRANKQLSNKTLDAGVTFSDKILEITIDGTETITANIEGTTAQPGFSDIPKTFDITGLTTLDYLAENNYVGIGNLTSGNPTENINQIDNFPTAFPFLLRPSAGLTLTITGTAIAGIGAGQIALTTTDVVLAGDSGEWLELEADPGGGGFLREKNRSGTLL